ncbi:oxygenase MpaB family protein [Allosphingosinicella deserti]|uniref:Histidine kinase n=1 Tax=Allosphingosinicella deserti TaxID=2116704 RepID=A0A2P7QUJ1_9SPHN|nr:oxygenase MpaB family protein [Sphingomonas deserti]PSJ41624.1 histidine kinase [Sphingomonas deserti]
MRTAQPTILRGGLALPAALRRWIDALAAELFDPPDVPPVDFSRPAGEAALVGPESVSWRIFKNPVTLFIGGVAAVILELAEPRVREGVWRHSTFRTDAMTRLQRTGMAAMLTVYGPRSKAEAMIAGVVRAHDRVAGTTSGGVAYSANDPELLDWVQATATFGFATAYSDYARQLLPDELDRAFAEGEAAAALYGAVGAPRSRADFDELAGRLGPGLEASPIVIEFLGIMTSLPALPVPARRFQKLLINAAVEIVPEWVRARLGLGPEWRLKSWQRPLVFAAAGLAERVRLGRSPAVQSCRRLGLPDDYLYHR